MEVYFLEEKNYDGLKLENQLCFPLYAAAKEVIKQYKPFLDSLDLTYTQYIAMMVLWEEESMNVKSLGEFLFLDSGTMTPVLKKLESKGFIERERSKEDERVLNVKITREGMQLRDEAVHIPTQMGKCIPLSREEAQELYRLLYKVLNKNSNE